MSDLYNVTSSPHIRAKDTTQRIMLYVIIALLPATGFGVFNFGIKALVLVIAGIASAVISEYLFNLATKRKQSVGDLSAVVTGLLLALNVPSGLPVWMMILGSAFAIVIVKMIFGGLGQNFMNPALGARCFLLMSFGGPMTAYTFDGASVATPLAIIKDGGSVDTMKMLIGTIPGTIGETSVIAILIGAMFLVFMGVIDLRIPGIYILTFAIFMLLFGGYGFDINYLVAELCGGGIMLGAFFMATDYATSPITPVGKIIFGICLGLLTGLFRVFGNSAEGVSFAIIFANLLVPLIEKITVPTAFGKGGKN